MPKTSRTRLLLILPLLLLIPSFSHQPTANDLQTTPAGAAQLQHIIWVWFENRELSSITAVTAPYFTSFAAANVNFTNFYGVSHPSQPNYLEAFSGSAQGVT